jgi:hypothetical protein
MAQCGSKKSDGKTCSSSIYKCEVCGTIGCKDKECPNCRFSPFCINCKKGVGRAL